MAYSYVQYVGNGSTVSYSVPFTYLSKNHVEVRVNNVLKTQGVDYTWTTSSTITFTTAPATGLTVDVRRKTSPATRLVDFQDGSTLTQEVLDTDSNQNFFLSQESLDATEQRLPLDFYGQWDANNRRIKNVTDPVNSQDVSTKNYVDTKFAADLVEVEADKIAAQNAATSAQNSLASFRGTYYGALASDPTVDPNGNAPTVGDIYYNSSVGELRVFGGSVWAGGTAGTVSVNRLSGNGSTTAFTLPISPAGEHNTQVYISGIYQQKDTYSLSGTTLTFSEAPEAGTDNIEVVTISSLSLGNTDSGLAAYTQGGTGSVQRNVQNKLRETVSIKDFGASPSASAATNNTAFAAAIAAVATTGQTIYVPAGTYALSQVFSTTGHLSILGDGDATVLDFTGLTSASSAITVSGSLTQIQNITNASKDGLTITFASAPSLVSGDVFVIYNPTDYSWSGFRPYYRAGEWCEAHTISGNDAKVNNPLYSGYTPANVSVYKMTSPNVSLRNFRIKGDNIAGLIKVSLCNSPLIENVSAYNKNYQCVEFDRCYKFVAKNLNLFNVGTNKDDYGLVVTNSQHGRVNGGYFYSRRHGIALGGGSDIGCVPTRDINTSGAVIKNDINSSAYSADFHGNTEDCIYENCTIYNGAGLGGKSSKLIACKITAAYGGYIVYAGEIKGGTHIVEGCQLYSGGSPTSIGRGYIDLGGNSSPVTSNTVEETTFIVRNCEFDLPASTSGDYLSRFVNNGATVPINFVFDGLVAINVPAISSILRTTTATGTASSNYIIVDNISRFPSGTYLHYSSDGSMSNFPHRCQRQTGKVTLSAASGVAYAIASAITFRYPYPREPVGGTTTSSSTGLLYNGNRTVYSGIYQLTSTYIRPYIESGDATNWASTASVVVNWSAGIDDI